MKRESHERSRLDLAADLETWAHHASYHVGGLTEYYRVGGCHARRSFSWKQTKSPVTLVAERLLPLVLLVVALTAQAQFNYTNDNGAITITRYTGTNPAVVIPSMIDGLPVTSIGDRAFEALGGVSSVVIPDGVTNIGYRAFLQCSLSSVTIPDSVMNIGNEAFQFCTSLSSVPIGNTAITRIGDHVFDTCWSLTSITIPNTVTSIGYASFQGCGHLPVVTIPNTVTSIGDWAFSACDRLTSVTIPDSVLSLGSFLLESCPALTNVTIGNRVRSIPEEAFAHAYNLTSVTIGNSVTNIGAYAFYGCSSLTSLTIPDGVLSLQAFALQACTGLKGVYFKGNAPSTVSSVFQNTYNATNYYLPGTLGWGSSLAGRPTAPWWLPYPLILNHSPMFGVKTNGFGFIISWVTNLPVVVEASGDLTSQLWSSLSTNTLTSGWSYFSDPQWTNYPARFYRARSQ